MRILGMRGLAIAAGLALASLGGVAGQAAPASQAAATAPDTGAAGAAPQAAAGPAGVSNTAPTSAAAPATANPSSPALAEDGGYAMAPTPGVGQPTPGTVGLQPQVTKNGVFAHWMHNAILMPTITAVSLLVLALLFWVVFRYRRAANPVPSKTSHNTVIEIIWTLAPVIILVLIAVPSIGLLSAQFKPAPAGAVTIKAIGNQWYWTYQYPDNGGFEVTANMLKEAKDVGAGERARTDADGPRLLATDNRIVLPVGVPIRLITTANDVIHSWAVPAFWIKLDAIPGRLNETSFTIDKPGLYFGQCSELCGARHAFMPIAVQAVSPAQFAAWVRAKGGTMPTPGQASDKVIPQPGADGSAAKVEEAAETANATGPVENVTTAAPATTQGATSNPAGAGNAGL
ncbi:cytochrome c oxidase subunit II [Sphingomonas aerolata]|jgi:cytochrome c oxidase subunit 2|uniref:cytochrome c oxidase subunit II n=2 Tax=Sphingomonadaceae TaxID=41297 RepID=UPI0006F6B7A4|nr:MULTISPECIES: cytochrome c oxidase subunit II [unclassified Sphingomonas]KQN21880.1 cytochrome C oxidase subunit II [Sphingomonas sp. Leaf30]MBD8551760.1 cytochrome c oxidase subunit II [Sphingomonas sp. CFBP 8764]MBD8639702.1 cytochrome c oxidase subunit II [Sphingomonas sp. CFBP 13733]